MDKQSVFQTDERPESLLRTLEQMEQDLDRCIGCRSCKVNCPFEAVIILPPKEDA